MANWLFTRALFNAYSASGLVMPFGFLRVISRKQVVVFSRQLATMTSSNVPIVKSLRILSKQVGHPHFQSVITQVADQVDAGTKLSIALSKFPKIFDNFFVYMIRAGETTGRLDEVLNYLADQKERDYELNNKIISALIYPSVILTGLIVVFVIMMVKVVPNMLLLVVQTGTQLPWTTRTLLAVSNTFVYGWKYMLLGVGVLVVVWFFMRRQPAGRLLLDRWKLFIPVFGTLYRKIFLTRFCRSLGNLLQSGVPINRALNIAADIVGNRVYRSLILRAEEEVEGGRTMSGSFSRSSFIPLMVVQMIGVGEETGRVDTMLSKAADFYSKEVERTTNNLVVLIEPLVIIALGIGVLILVAGILLPIYDISSQF